MITSEARKTLARAKSVKEPVTPIDVYKMMRKGTPRLRAWRQYRKLHCADVARAADISLS